MRNASINGILTAAMAFALVLAGCVSAPPATRVDVAQITINGKSARFQLDTGSPSTVIYNSAARRLGLKFADSTDPVEFRAGGQAFSAPLPIFKLPWAYRHFGGTEGEDGLIGWPEVRGNILAFDAERRAIRRLEKLPPESGNWTKLKVMRSRWLLLEPTLPGGKRGVILIDTGAPLSVQMALPQWLEWKVAHPTARITSHRGAGYSFGSFKFQSAWTDDVQVGPLRLGNLEVESMPEAETTFLRKEAPRADAVWALGMYALRRLDLIVDWNSGFAYLRRKPGNAPSGTAADWTVAENVRLQPDNLFVVVGEDQWSKKQYDGALGNYDQAIKLNPENSDAYSDRADIKAMRGKFAEAIGDYNRSLELNPENADAYSGRAVIGQIQADFQAAIADYSKAVELRPTESFYEQLLREICRRKSASQSKKFSQAVAGWNPGWTKSIGMFLNGELDENALLAAAKKKGLEPVAGQKCEAYYYIAEMRLEHGDKNGAREALEKCRDLGRKEFPDYAEYQLAGAELSKMETATAE